MSTVAVKLTWDRLGRSDRRDGFEEIITILDSDDFGDDLADAIYRIARRHLFSSDFAVHARGSGAGTFSIEGDRFGKGRWTVVTTISDGKTLDKPGTI